MLRMPGCPSALHWHIDIGVVRVRRLVTSSLLRLRAIGHGPPEPQHPLLSNSASPRQRLAHRETIPPMPFGPYRLPSASFSPHLQSALFSS